MMPALQCVYCEKPLEAEDRFCTQCGQTTAQIRWSSSLDARPGTGTVVLPPSGSLSLVAENTGGYAIRVRVDTARLRGLRLIGNAEAHADRRQSVAFALRHVPEETISGFVVLWSDDGHRPHPSAQEPQSPWWEVCAARQKRLRAQEFVRIVADRWILGSPNLLFPPGVRKQYVRIWNDAEQNRSFVSDVPGGYRITNLTLPIEKRASEVFAHGQIELIAEAPLEHLAKGADREWLAGPDVEAIPLVRLDSPTGAVGEDVVIAIDFGTRNTGVRARWRHSLVEGKPKGTVDIIGDRNGNGRFPTEMALHRNGRSFRWGSDVPRGMLGPEEIRIRNLKTLLRVNAEPYLQENPRWTNAYLLERYFEELFVRIDDYFTAAAASLSRNSLNIRYVMTRPVLDANEGDTQGKSYELALTTALEQCGVDASLITFVHEPVAAAYGIAKRRAQELLALGEGTPIAVIDAGGGTTDIAVGYVSLRAGRVALDIRETYALHLDTANPALPAVERFGDSDRREFGGDVLDYALTYRLLTDASALLETEGRAVPPHLEVSATPLPAEEKQGRESELVLSCRTMKEAFAHVSTHHLTRSANQAVRDHEHFIFANRPDYEGIYLEQSLVGENLIAPILRTPLQDLREEMEQDGFEAQGIRPSKIKHIFYVGGTNIEFYLRQQFQEAFPNSPRLQAEGPEGVEERIAERLNAVVEGAVWCDEALFAASPLTLTLTLNETEKWRLPQGDPLPPESASRIDRFLVQLEPFQELEANLSAIGSGLAQPIPVARGFYRNTSDTLQEGALQMRVSREKGVTATLVINSRSYEQWRVALVETV